MNIAAKGNITKTVLLLIVIIFSFALPLAAPDAFSLVVFTVALVFIILSSSWNLVYGYAGQISLGHPAFLGIGGYTAAYLGGIISPWLAILAGGLAGALAGFVIGLPSLRLRGIYLGIATFAFPAILEQFTLSFEQYTGGQTGLSVIRLTPVAIPFIGTISFDSNISYYYLFLIMTLGSIFAIYLMVRSKIGLILTSIKDDENLTKAMGINTTKYKMIAFVTSAFFAGLAGSLYAVYLGYVDPLRFDFSIMVLIFAMIYIGGMGTIIGPILGTIIVRSVFDWGRFVVPPGYLQIAFGIILVLLILLKRGGIYHYLLALVRPLIASPCVEP